MNYIYLFKNVRDERQVYTISQQMFPANPQRLLEAYRDATQTKHGYLLINLLADADDDMRLVTNIFPGDYPIVYLPRLRT